MNNSIPPRSLRFLRFSVPARLSHSGGVAFSFIASLIFLSCQSPSFKNKDTHHADLTIKQFTEGSWQHFLQNLPLTEGRVVNYRGEPVSNSEKAFALVNYDVGNKDLQQCADALIRFRAEYLFTKNRLDDIQFHFTSGDLYSFHDYCQGVRPVPVGVGVVFQTVPGPKEPNYEALRKYLDIVYTYAGTISLARDLRNANDLEVGTVIVKPGSPGHCFIIVDEAVNNKGEKLYRLAEGFTPAQSIYILKNPANGSPWHELKPGESIQTASYTFHSYKLKSFE
jgi:hypothetical protein